MMPRARNPSRLLGLWAVGLALGVGCTERDCDVTRTCLSMSTRPGLPGPVDTNPGVQPTAAVNEGGGGGGPLVAPPNMALDASTDGAELPPDTLADAGPTVAVVVDPPCTGLALPHEDSCVLADGAAVFVSPRGTVDGPGTRLEPTRSLSQAVARLNATGASLLLLCHGLHVGPLSLVGEDAAGAANLPARPLRIVGGFDCTTWSYAPEAGESLIIPLVSVPALTVDGVTERLDFQDLSFSALNAVANGENSVAAVVSNSVDVLFERVLITAGDGGPALPSTLTSFVLPGLPELAGHQATTTSPGGELTVECPGAGTTTGGMGGVLGVSPGSGVMGLPSGSMGQGGIAGLACANFSDQVSGSGRNGSPGADGASGAPATIAGTVVGTAWLPSAGNPGGSGFPGQGGGGGAATTNGHGGGGGAGGCGGAGGPGGRGGGGSIALISVLSSVSLVNSELSTGTAGNGAAGLPGQLVAATGGIGGIGSSTACAGGIGGKGGDGGPGAGGTGGSSIGIVYVGLVPATTGVDFALGTPGARGERAGPGASDGLEGAALSRFEVL